MKIFIIGFKSSGKTTQGEIIAEKFLYNFFDVDLELLKKFKFDSINKLFNHLSEDIFRKEEAIILNNLLKNDNCVISLGGGTLFNKYFKKNLKKYGKIILIDTDINIIKERLNNIQSIYNNKDIEKLYQKRITYFRKISDYILK